VGRREKARELVLAEIDALREPGNRLLHGNGPRRFSRCDGGEGVEARARRGWTLLGRRALGLREIDHDLFQFVEIGVLARFVEVRQPGPRETRRRPLGTRIHPLDARLQRAEREFSVRVALPRLGAHTSRR